MAKHVQDQATGRMRGSIGDGKTRIPTADLLKPAAIRLNDTSIAADVDDMYATFATARPQPDKVTPDNQAQSLALLAHIDLTDCEVMDAFRAAFITIRQRLGDGGELKDDARWDVFIRQTRFLNPQQYGIVIEKWLIHRWKNMERVPATMDRGDMRDVTNDKHYEIKCSIITPKNNEAHFMQLRTHQDIAGYHLFVVEEVNKYSVVHFYLTKEQMNDEIGLTGNRSSHGSGDAAGTEKDITLTWNLDAPNDRFRRWLDSYQAALPRSHPLSGHIRTVVPPPADKK